MWVRDSLSSFEAAQCPGGSYRFARKAWSKMHIDDRKEWIHNIQEGKLFSCKPPSLSDLQSMQAGRKVRSVPFNEGPVKEKSDKTDNAKNGTRGGMLTWHGRWGHDIDEVKDIMAMRAPPHIMVERIQKNVFYKELWQSFKEFVKTVMRRDGWPEFSLKMEVSLHRRQSENIVHFHACMTEHTGYHIKHENKYWEFAGAVPHFVPLQAKGPRQAEKAKFRLHYYVQAPKIGTVFVATNLTLDGVIDATLIYQLWRQRKMLGCVARAQIQYQRCPSAKTWLEYIEFHENREQAAREEALRQVLALSLPLSRFKDLPVVKDWMCLYIDHWGKATRFKFLVLNGPSQMGKTRFAESLWGQQMTLVTSCQGVRSPNLKNFQRARHRCIVFDEASSAMVVNNKQLFQAGLDLCQLGQSQCNQHSYTTWLYAIPLIISTNDWLRDITDEGEKHWLEANSVLVEVTEPLFFQNQRAICDGDV